MLRKVNIYWDILGKFPSNHPFLQKNCHEPHRAFIFTTSGYLGLVSLPTIGDRTSDSFSVSQIFPGGAYSTRVIEYPGTNQRTAYHWRIFVSNHNYPPPVNKAIRTVFDCQWLGNIVVMKHGGGRRRLMNMVHRSDKMAIVTILSGHVYPSQRYYSYSCSRISWFKEFNKILPEVVQVMEEVSQLAE